MSKKYGPLPLWAWGLVGGVMLYLYWRHAQSSAAASSSTVANTPTSSVLDPNAIDPNTGLTYGQEESAALQGLGVGGAYSGSPGPSIGTYTPTGTSADTGVQSFDQSLSDLLALTSAFNLVPAGTQAASAPPPANTSTPATTSPAAPPPQVVNASTPAVTPQVNTPNTAYMALQAQNNTVLGQIHQLLSGGFHKIAGTTQSGGLAQTGTYVYSAPRGKNRGGGIIGPSKYFVYGTSQTGLHIRAA